MCRADVTLAGRCCSVFSVYPLCQVVTGRPCSCGSSFMAPIRGIFAVFRTLGSGISLDTFCIPFTLHRCCRAWTAFIRAGLSLLPALRHGRPVRGSASLRPPGRIVGPPIQKRSPSCHVPTCCHPLPFRPRLRHGPLRARRRLPGACWPWLPWEPPRCWARPRPVPPIPRAAKSAIRCASAA